ncbi:MAG: cytochrome c [Alphaproteobacteria bacterium]|nr:cytochrome c [Alphaproteobacteria bacterium]MBO6865065.1 cytochrome c [Alphaproteobacteria bacterium]
MAGNVVFGVGGLIIGAAAVFAYTHFTAAPAPEMAAPEAAPAEAMAAATVAPDQNYMLRNSAMKAIAGHMKALGAVAKGEATADAGTVVHAQGLNSLAQTVPLLFDVEAIPDKSRAKAEIWSDWAGFQKAADDFAAATQAVVAAAETGDPAQLGAALGEVGKTCGGCHKPFRAPEQ